MKKVIYSKFSNERDEKFNIRTDIIKDGNGEKYVLKAATAKESEQHIKNILKWNDNLSAKFQNTMFVPNKAELCEDGVRLEFLEGESLSEILDRHISENDVVAFLKLIEKYVFEIKKVYSQDLFQKTPDFVKIFGDVELPNGLLGSTYVDIDLIFPNIIVKDDKWYVIDYEWTFDFCIPVNFVIYRALRYFTFMVQQRQAMLGDDVFSKYGITGAEIVAYEKMEQHFQSYVFGEYKSLVELNKKLGKRKIGFGDVWNASQVKHALCTIQVYFDKGTGYCEENSYYVYAEPEENGLIKVDVEFDENVKELRIDPAQKECVVEILDFYCNDDKNDKVDYTTNGFWVSENMFLFETNDPQIIITKANGNKVHLEYCVSNIKSKIVANVVAVVNHQIEKMNRLINVHYQEKQVLMEEHNQEKQQIQDRYKQEKKDLEKKYLYELADRDRIISGMNAHIHEKDLTIQHLNNINAQTQAIVDQMQGSISWRITRPVRFIGRILRKIKLIKYVGQKIKFVMKVGVVAAVKHFSKKLLSFNAGILEHEDTQIADAGTFIEENAVAMKAINNLQECSKRIAIHVHLFYTDLLGEFLGYLNNIPYPFDVYVSCCEGADVKKITKRIQYLDNVQQVNVKILPNHGRDIAPLYVWFAKDIEKYDYLLHVHSKKSLYTGNERKGWRQYSLDSLLGSKDIVQKIFWMFEHEERVGLVYPDNHEEVPMQAYMWLANEGKGREFLHRVNVPFENGIFMYPAGSFFWARVDAIKPLFDANLTIDDFDAEAGQTDGTLAHVIERATGLIAKHRNYRSAIIDYREGVVRWDMSLKAFRPYLNANAEDVLNFLMQYDVISFDIFDTLLTRGILKPDDLFELMRLKVKNMFDIDMNYIEVRKNAEWEANKTKGAYTNIHDIYAEFEKITGFEHEVVEQMKQLEMDLEYNLILPRRDMRKIFNGLKKAGKHVILVSDMYLPGEVIKGFLSKCGYEECDEMWVSCECGLRKDQDNIWDAVFAKYEGKRLIHVGDNARSDWQTIVDRRKESYWIMSAADEWKISPYYNKFRKYDNGEIVNSLMLGMTLNGGMFNSPFALNDQAQPEFEESRSWGYSVFGPLFYKFMMWLDDEVEEDGVIAFLAREGYILEPLYAKIMEGLGKEAKPHHYLLTSRRAVTVAGIKDWDDVRDIVSKLYKGALSNLLKARLGIGLPEGVEDRDIVLFEDTPDVIDEVMQVIQMQSDELFAHVEEEKDAYMNYIKNLIPEDKWDKMTVVDVGYSGTIQYYLAKLLDKKVSGRYLASFGDTKPDKIGCSIEATYDPRHGFTWVLHPTQLFLESVLQAPMGQLICLEKNEDGVSPVHKPDENVPQSIVDLQKGIMDYCEMLAVSLKDTEQSILDTGDLVEDIYTELVNGKVMSNSLADIFTVEDDYCSNGVLKFNKELNCWQ